MLLFSKSDIGLVRKSNQDSFYCSLIFDDVVLGVVCDGMGGANAGDIASEVAVNKVVENIKLNYCNDMKESDIRSLLISSIKLVNTNIYDMSLINEEYSGMGTTIVVALVVRNIIYIAYVGDSRAYIINSERISQITTDHSVVQEMVKDGRITSEEAINHPKKNIITRALGVSAKVEVDYLKEFINKDEFLMICTDGLTNHLTSREIYDVFFEYNKNEKSIPDVLISRAKQSGGQDNITVIVIKNDMF